MAAYVFRVRFRLDPDGVRVDPDVFETVLRIPAPTPGEKGWLFFQRTLWRGAVGDESHMRSVAEDHLGVPVASVRSLPASISYHCSWNRRIPPSSRFSE